MRPNKIKRGWWHEDSKLPNNGYMNIKIDTAKTITFRGPMMMNNAGTYKHFDQLGRNVINHMCKSAPLLINCEINCESIEK